MAKGDQPAAKTVVKTVSRAAEVAIKTGDTSSSTGPSEVGRQRGTRRHLGRSGKRLDGLDGVRRAGRQADQSWDKVLDAVKGKKVGSRILVQGIRRRPGYGENRTRGGIKPQGHAGLRRRPVGAATVEATASAKGTRRSPRTTSTCRRSVPDTDGKAPTITVPKGAKAPKRLEQQVLIKGERQEGRGRSGAHRPVHRGHVGGRQEVRHHLGPRWRHRLPAGTGSW